jgi:hypothetical protein
VTLNISAKNMINILKTPVLLVISLLAWILNSWNMRQVKVFLILEGGSYFLTGLLRGPDP